MGTNYYAHLNVCECCGKTEKIIHIGKNSFGWQFIFAGYKDLESEGVNSKFKRIISSRDWYNFLLQENVQVRNEYGDIINKTEFWEMVNKKQNDKRNMNSFRINNALPETENERAYVSKMSVVNLNIGHGYENIDEDGFSICFHEFF